MNRLARQIRKSLQAVDGVVESDGVFGEGPEFWVNGKQVAHFDSDNTIELRITRQVFTKHRERLKADARIRRHGASSDWIDVQFGSNEDVAFVLELAELAAAAHRAPNGVTPEASPVGADLERRRRFH